MRYFVSHIVPPDHVEKLDVSQAENYFSYNLIKSELFDSVFSLPPTNIDSRFNDIKSFGVAVNFIQSNSFINGHLGKFYRVVVANIRLYNAIKNDSSVWYYNLTKQTIISFLLLRIFRKRVKCYVILLDFTPKKWTNQYIVYSLGLSYGVISLSQNRLLKKLRHRIIPGIMPDSDYFHASNQIALNRRFLWSGRIGKNRHPELVLRVFSKLDDVELLITGIFDDTKLLSYYTANFKNIKYLGLVSYDEYISILLSCSFSINSRDSSFAENHFNFPSKVIEHLLYDRIVLSTMPLTELAGVKYVNINSTEIDFENQIKELLERNSTELITEYCGQQTALWLLCGKNNWVRSMFELENNL